MVSCSSSAANSKSESASSCCGGKPSEQYGDGSAQSVHSRAMLKLPRSNSRSRRVSMPAIRRAFKTSKRWLRSGWNGWRISAHPKCELRSGAVRADRGGHRRQHYSDRDAVSQASGFQLSNPPRSSRLFSSNLFRSISLLPTTESSHFAHFN